MVTAWSWDTVNMMFDAVLKACALKETPYLDSSPELSSLHSPMKCLEDKWADISLHVPGNDGGKLGPLAGVYRLQGSWGVGGAATISLLCWQPSACPWRNHSCPLSACVVKAAARAVIFLPYGPPRSVQQWDRSGTGPRRSQCDAFPKISQGLDREVQQSRMLSALSNWE